MKCKKCGNKASVNMRQHRLALCKEHYLEWVPEQAERFIKKYEMFTHGDRILVAVSGEKIRFRCGISLSVLVTRPMASTLASGLTAASATRQNLVGWRQDSRTSMAWCCM